MKYEVEVWADITLSFEVEADDEKAANDKAMEQVHEDLIEGRWFVRHCWIEPVNGDKSENQT